MEPVRILLIDDHPIIREGLVLFLGKYPELSIVGTAADAGEALEKLRSLQPDLVIADLVLPGEDGIETIWQILRQQPDIPLVVYSGHEEEALVHEALYAGVRGYVLKTSPIADLVSAIRAVRDGGVWLSPRLKSPSMQAYLRDQNLRVSPLRQLTTRELQVFRLLARGLSTKEIGEELNISPKTVAKHRLAVKAKLKLKNAAEMANFAMRNPDPHGPAGRPHL